MIFLAYMLARNQGGILKACRYLVKNGNAEYGQACKPLRACSEGHTCCVTKFAKDRAIRFTLRLAIAPFRSRRNIIDLIRGTLTYPKAHNSECNLVASDALLNAADNFEKHFSENGVGLLNRRMRIIVKTAIETHYKILSELKNHSTEKQCEVMLKVCKGELIKHEELIEAERLDQQL